MDIKRLLTLAAQNNASDLHVVKGLKPFFRIDGELFPIDTLFKGTNDDFEIVSSKELSKAVETLLDVEHRQKFYKNKDLDFGYSIDNYRFRINLFYERGNISFVARVIRELRPSLEDVGMPEVIYKLLGARQGMILLTGPTGCGKSTSLAAMINYLNDNFSYNIITLEDPIEYIFSSSKSIIVQRQLDSDMETFASGLKHVLRQDPNVIMVGEMRDLETISTALTLAETGHLVLATLHTFNAAQTVDRIIDVFPPYQQGQVRAQLANVLNAVISQKLIPKVGGGRIAMREVMIRNAAISTLIRDQKLTQIKNVIDTSYQDGMLSFGRHIKELYNQGLISKEVAEAQLIETM